MQLKDSIKRTVSLLLFLVFAFSITPKQWIHKLIFQHKDVYTVCTDGSFKTHLHQTGFHCELNNIIVLSPFTSDVSVTEAEVPLIHSLYYSPIENDADPVSYFFFNLRGPPAIG